MPLLLGNTASAGGGINSPTEISGLLIWSDLSDPNGNGSLPSNNSTLSYIADKSGNGYHLNTTGPEGSPSYPRWDASVKNGKGAGYFGGNNAISKSSVAISLPSGGVTSFIVVKTDTLSTGGGSMMINNGTPRQYINWYRNPGSPYQYRWEAGPTPMANYDPSINTDWYILAGRQRSGADGFYWKDSKGYSYSATGESIINIATANYTLGQYSGNHNGYIGEHIMYNSALTNTQIDLVFDYLKAKWAI